MKLDRRQFIKESALAGATVGLAPRVEPVRAVPPSDRVGVGIIGCGGMGRGNQADFQKYPEVEVVAACDVYQTNLEQSLKMTQGKAKPYRDYRKLLENRDVQAVVIATPDHWHPLICIEACNAGKDVYVEKPVSNVIREGRLMVEAARRNQRVVQVGLQQRSGTHFQRAVKIVQEGQLGRIHYVQCWNHERSNPEGMGNPPDSDPPAGLDWNFWLGPAPKAPFNKNRFLGSWRWFFDYGGGKVSDWGSHLIDIVHWAMKVEGPQTVAASGGKYYMTDNRDTPDTYSILYEYPGFILHYSTLIHSSYGHTGNPGAKPFGSYGILFQGNLGSLFVDRAGYEIIPQPMSHSEPGGVANSGVDDLTGNSLYYTSQLTSGRGSTSVQHMPHVKNFLECLRTRQRPIADIEVGYQATTACQLGNIALRTGEKIHWDAKAGRITNSAKANEMVTRPYRAPWRLEGL